MIFNNGHAQDQKESIKNLNSLYNGTYKRGVKNGRGSRSKRCGRTGTFYGGRSLFLAEVPTPKMKDFLFPASRSPMPRSFPHGSTLPHKLIKSSEVYWIIDGSGTLYINRKSVDLKKGRAVLVPPSAEQYVVNNGDKSLEFICIVSSPWDESDEEII